MGLCGKCHINKGKDVKMNQDKNYDLDELFDDSKCRETYWIESAKIDFTEEICKCMEKQNINRKELAKRIGSSPAYITKILRGNANFTLESMVRISRALGSELRCHLQPDGAISQWFDMVYQTEEEENIDLTEQLKHYFEHDCSKMGECKDDAIALKAS